MFLPSPWRGQPRSNAEIDWSNPITRSLRLLVDKRRQIFPLAAPTITGTLDRFVNVQGAGTTQAGAGLAATQATGFYSTFGAGTSDAIRTTFTEASTLRTYLIWFLENDTGGNGFGRAFDKLTSGTVSESLQANGSNIDYVRSSAAASHWFIDKGGFFQGTGYWAQCVITHDTTSTLTAPLGYWNGTTSGVTQQTAPSGAWVTTSEAFVVGNRGTDNARGWDGIIGPFMVFDRILDPAEIWSLYVNPWQIYKPLQSRIYVATQSAPVVSALLGQACL